ncbi:hypothetical protein A3J90_02240 [candidate division WOR-1 bacterium RIFOXYC2_FULL_37_10]|uniref:RNA 2-O ribose methyltransferase substrate binding domain-containing protein n=1 Tax=candidate division WOR-1 bacterium RIFOXYB2_FULL_37_13 TaxID=1802579 RepID=A0A1F4SP11_UNCSA|nr:MAG: hypothetical protein A2246_04690 [candidate division WOR-1 bacterium RIFOXYA2_FULL_37_7]OGC22165.1 MAG: hypothetical protein A2310_04935 [candidate division WOR-1 bacterium RIFOXYB2_FULL_37_13]OGC37074.1 MAG: hypothetical protein A3J90_02240 [candidate division WOR-1 bacterium RIFOXYC2_FULL_37_10]
MKLNPRAKLAFDLIAQKKLRQETLLFVAEGEKLVLEALTFGKIKFILFSKESPIVLSAQKKGIENFRISQKEMDKISSVETSQGILAVCKNPSYDFDSIFNPVQSSVSLILFPVEIQDPGNLGTMIRTVDAVNGSGMIISRGTVEPYNPKVVRSTMGSIFRVPIVEIKEISSFLKKLKDKGINIVGTDLNTEKTHWEVDFKKPTVLLIGNESSGLSSEALELCDETIKIPIPGKAESLNAAMAASIILYEAVRQRNC